MALLAAAAIASGASPPLKKGPSAKELRVDVAVGNAQAPTAEQGLQHARLAKLGLQPTHILDQYQGPASRTVHDEKIPEPVQRRSPHRHGSMDDGTELMRVQDAWDQIDMKVNNLTPGKGKGKGNPWLTSPISHSEAFRQIVADIDNDTRQRIKVHDFREAGFWTRAKYRLLGDPALEPSLARERDDLFCLAATKLDYSRPAHEQVLQSIFKRITGHTGDSLDVPRFGNHWEDAGFQGTDPGTDLRGVGMLGPLQMVYLLEYYRPLSVKIYALSRDEHQNFPWAVVSLNITGVGMQIVRQGKLHRLFRKAKSVFSIVMLLHCALFYEFYLMWKNNGSTIMDFSATRALLARRASDNPAKIILKFLQNNSDGTPGVPAWAVPRTRLLGCAKHES